MSRGIIKQAEAVISSATDTALVAAPEATQHIEVIDIHARIWSAQAQAKIRFEDAAGGNLLVGLGAGSGSAVTNNPVGEHFPIPYKITAGKGISVETTGTGVWYVFVAYRLVDTLA